MKEKLLLLFIAIMLSAYSNAQIIVKLKLPNPCASVGFTQPIDNSTDFEMKIKPNPSNGIFTMELTSQNAIGKFNVKIYNMQGTSTYNQDFYGSSNAMIKVINLQHLPSGIYLLTLIGDNKQLIKKIIIN